MPPDLEKEKKKKGKKKRHTEDWKSWITNGYIEKSQWKKLPELR